MSLPTHLYYPASDGNLEISLADHETNTIYNDIMLPYLYLLRVAYPPHIFCFNPFCMTSQSILTDDLTEKQLIMYTK